MKKDLLNDLLYLDIFFTELGYISYTALMSLLFTLTMNLFVKLMARILRFRIYLLKLCISNFCYLVNVQLIFLKLYLSFCLYVFQ